MKVGILVLLLLFVGCTPTIKMVTPDGLPAPDNITTLETTSGLFITQKIVRTYEIKEGDETLVLQEYVDAWAPCTILPKKSTANIIFHVAVQNPNKIYYEAGMQHVIVDKTGEEKVRFSDVIYKGNLSFKELRVELPFIHMNGKQLQHRVVFRDAEGNLRAVLPFFKYVLKGGGTKSRVVDSCF